MQMGISIMKRLISLIQKADSPQGAALCCPKKRCGAMSMGHSCKAGGMLPASLSVPSAGAGTSWVVCRGGKSAVMLWPGAWAGALACGPWVVLHYVPLHCTSCHTWTVSFQSRKQECSRLCIASERIGQ